MRRWLLLAGAVLGCAEEEPEMEEPPVVAQGCAPGERPLDDGGCLPAGVPATECGEGFVAEADGCAAILPPAACPRGTMALPGESRCREVAPCGAPPWGDIPDEPNREHVDASYAGGMSDGSATRPWTTIQTAIAAAEPGAIVAIAPGAYTEAVIVRYKPVRLWGLCPAEVEISPPADATAAIVVLDGASGSEVHNLAVTGLSRGLGITGAENVIFERLWIHDTAIRGLEASPELAAPSFTIRDSLIESVTHQGMFITHAIADIQRVLVRDVVATDTPAAGTGIQIQRDLDYTMGRATATLTNSVIERAPYAAIFVGGADATMERIVLRDLEPTPLKTNSGIGLIVQHIEMDRSNAIARQVVVERARQIGIAVTNSDLLVELTTVRDTLQSPFELDHGATGVAVQSVPVGPGRGSLTLRASLVERSNAAGLVADAGDLVVESTLVRDTGPEPSDLLFGRGVSVQAGFESGEPSSTIIRWSRVEQSHDVGIVGTGSDLMLEGVLIQATQTVAANGSFGDGIALEKASAEIRASLVRDSARAGIAVFQAGATVGNTQLECNTIHLDGEIINNNPFVFTDLGGNRCGCEGEVVPCKVLTSGLAPPAPLP